MFPRLVHLLRDGTHRLILSCYSDPDASALSRLTKAPDEREALVELEGATNERLQGEAGLLPGITVRELVFGLSYSHIVNAAFTHSRPTGNRYNGPERGAWYAGFSPKTSSIEVAYHKGRELQEINWQKEEVFTYVDFLADFRGKFHDLRRDSRFAECLDPSSYDSSQRLARALLDGGSAGIVYPSVRHRGGTCIACFRPALVNNVRRGGEVSITFANAFAVPDIRV